MKKTVNASVVCGRQEISSPAGSALTLALQLSCFLSVLSTVNLHLVGVSQCKTANVANVGKFLLLSVMCVLGLINHISKCAFVYFTLTTN